MFRFCGPESSAFLTLIVGGVIAAAAGAAVAETPGFPLPVPPQDQGLPYTRSGRPMARQTLGQDIAILPGSRYVYAFGYRTRLDVQHPLQGAAVEHDGVVYVPEEFAAVILANSVQADEAPSYLADRYVHTLTAPSAKLAEGIRRIEQDGRPYVAAEDVAKSAGKGFARGKDGLLIIGEASPAFLKDPVRTDAVITLFDTPDMLADPDIATEYIPLLKRQGSWAKWVKHTPEQLKLLEGPETKWPLVPKEQFDYSGFNAKLLGSKVPAPGVYPRILFSPEDLPALRERVKRDRTLAYSFAEMEALLKRTWFNPKADEAKAFGRLASGKPITLEEIPESDRKRGVPLPFGLFQGEKGGIYTTHVPYIGHCLVAIELYALIQDNEELGRKAAAAAITYCELMERGIDQINAKSDSDFGIDYDNAQGAETGYRARTAADHMNLAFLLDFGGKYMNAQQKDSIRRLIAKATYGLADSHSAGSIRWEENNHTTWHTTAFLSQIAIEGLEGSDPESFPRALRTIQAFSEFGIDPQGVVFESNGKSGAGFRNILLNMIAAARRGENYFGHPHWRHLVEAQAQCTSPNGTTTVTSGAYAGGLFDAQGLMTLKAFYPGNRCADWLLTKAMPNLDVSAKGTADHAEQVLAGKLPRTRLPIFTAPLSERGGLYDTDFIPMRREELGLPLVFDSKVHGMFSAYSDNTEKASWMNLLVRENGYLGAGHQHADSGMFHFSALGVNWVQESPLNGSYEGNLHNHVMIDGKSTPDGPGASGHYLGSVNETNLAFASADLKLAYTWKWIQQVMLWDEATWWSSVPLSQQGVEFEDDPRVVAAFKGTQRYKMRNWWPSYTFGNWIPTSRLAYNPVELAQRTVGLVRGAHSYGVVADAIKKDEQSHVYQWSACPGRGVWKSDYAAAVAPLPANQLVLGFEGPQAFAFNYKSANHNAKPEVLAGKAGDAQLLVCVLNELTPPQGQPLMQVITREGPMAGKNKTYYDNLVISHEGKEGQFRVLLIPFKRGEQLPVISYDKTKQVATVSWPDQVDQLAFIPAADRTTFTLRRGATK